MRRRRIPIANTLITVLQRVGGKDASKQFWKYHNEAILKKFQPKLKIGSLDSKKKEVAAPPPAAEKAAAAASGEAAKKGTPVKPRAASGAVSAAPTEDFEPPLDMFGDLVPYADPNWYQSVSTFPSSPMNSVLIAFTVPLAILQPEPCRPPRRSPSMGRRSHNAKCHRMG